MSATRQLHADGQVGIQVTVGSETGYEDARQPRYLRPNRRPTLGGRKLGLGEGRGDGAWNVGSWVRPKRLGVASPPGWRPLGEA